MVDVDNVAQQEGDNIRCYDSTFIYYKDRLDVHTSLQFIMDFISQNLKQACLGFFSKTQFVIMNLQMQLLCEFVIWQLSRSNLWASSETLAAQRYVSWLHACIYTF